MPKAIDYENLLTKRKDGRFQGSYMDENGKQCCITGSNAEVLYHKIEKLKQPKPPTVKEIAEAWYDKYWDGYKDGTKACYKANYDRIIDKHGGKNANELSAADISKYLQELADQKLSKKVIKTVKTLYNLIYRNAIIDEKFGRFISDNPAIYAPIPSKAKAPVKREAPEDEIVDKIRQSASTAYFGLFPMLLISTGFRRGEALALTWGDMDFKGKTISCNKSISYRSTAKLGSTKTEAGERTVPLLPDLAKVLKKPKGAKDSDYIFISDAGSFLPQSTYKRRWMHYCKDMGFVDITTEERKSKQGKRYIHSEYKNTLTAHVLRHGYATMLYDAGVDVYTAQKLLGHANVETTIAVYTHLSKRKQQQSIDALTSYVSNGYKLPNCKSNGKKPKGTDAA